MDSRQNAGGRRQHVPKPVPFRPQRSIPPWPWHNELLVMSTAVGFVLWDLADCLSSVHLDGRVVAIVFACTIAVVLVGRGHGVQGFTPAAPNGVGTEMHAGSPCYRIVGLIWAVDRLHADRRQPFRLMLPEIGMIRSLVELIAQCSAYAAFSTIAGNRKQPLGSFCGTPRIQRLSSGQIGRRVSRQRN